MTEDEKSELAFSDWKKRRKENYIDYLIAKGEDVEPIMKRYHVLVETSLSTTVEVMAENKDDAKIKAIEICQNTDYLSADLATAQFKTSAEEDETYDQTKKNRAKGG